MHILIGSYASATAGVHGRDRPEARQRDGSGVRSIRIVRVIDPDGNLRIIDFAAEVAMNQRPTSAQVCQSEDRGRFD